MGGHMIPLYWAPYYILLLLLITFLLSLNVHYDLVRFLDCYCPYLNKDSINLNFLLDQMPIISDFWVLWRLWYRICKCILYNWSLSYPNIFFFNWMTWQYHESWDMQPYYLSLSRDRNHGSYYFHFYVISCILDKQPLCNAYWFLSAFILSCSMRHYLIEKNRPYLLQLRGQQL